MSTAEALAHRADANRVARAAAQGVRAEWAQVDPGEIRASWAALLPRALTLVSAAQLAAAGLSEPYLRRVLGLPPGTELNPAALAGVASDGRPLDTLLAQPAITALTYLATGRAVGDAMAAGLAMLEMIVGTQVHDAARVADLVGITARPGVAYTRVVDLPACARCIVLAGQTYSYSEGFERHPNCDCAVMPLRSGDAAPLSPRDLFDAMSPAEQLRRFGAAGTAAILAGADIGQVVNARRGMTVAGGLQATTEGMTRRGVAGRLLGSVDDRGRFRASREVRLMPEQILAQAEDRDAAVAALIRYGYLSAIVAEPEPEPVVLTPPVQVLADPPTMSDEALEAELSGRMADGDMDSPRALALVAEMDRRDQAATEPEPVEAEPPAPVDGRVAAGDLAWFDDDRLGEMLMEAFAEGRERDAAVIEQELDQRAALAHAPAPEVEVDPDETDAEREQREAEDAQYERMRVLVEEDGWSWEEAAAEVQGRTVESLRREDYVAQHRVGDDRRSFVELAREQYKLEVARRWEMAEDVTNGFLLTPAAQSAGIDPQSLFSGPRSRAEKHASEELKRWWDENGRYTFEEYVESIEQGRDTREPGRDFNR